MNIYARILPYIRPHRLRFAQACVAMLGVAIFNGGALYLLKPIVDHVFVSRDFTMLWLVLVGVPALVALKTIFSYVQNYLMSWIGQHAIQELREDLFRHLHSLSLEYYAEHESGEILSRVTNDLNTLQSTLNSIPLYLIRDSLTVLILIFVLFWVDWRFALLALLSLPAIGVTLVVLGRKMRQSSLESQVLMARIYRRFQESLRGMAVIQAYNYEEGAIDKFRDENLLFFNEMMRYLRATALTAPLMEFAGSMVVALLLYYGATEIIDNKMTPGAFFAFMGSFFAAYAPAKNVARLNSELQRGLASAERIFQLLDEKPVRPNPAARPFKQLESDIEFAGVVFQYPEAERPALRGVSFKIRRGERVAIVGPAGAGKSTLVHLLVRLYEPTRGAILFDGVPLPELDVRSVRERIALITKDPLVLNDTVLQNVTMGRKVVTLSQVEAACKSACAADFIGALPQGFLTRLGERTVRPLTAGQRQRLAVARALLKDPCLVVLNGAGEPDAAAGDETERALAAVMEGRTVLQFTDRVMAAANADRIFVLRSGEILESGTHTELLLRKGGFYRRLYQLQIGPVGEEAPPHPSSAGGESDIFSTG